MSNQCVSLVRDDCFIPTIDAPELGYIKESTNEQYVPDVFYKVNHVHICVAGNFSGDIWAFFGILIAIYTNILNIIAKFSLKIYKFF